MHYNAKGAFIGDVLVDVDADAPLYGNPNTRSMLYNSFLATPLLDITGRFEVRLTDHEGEPCSGHDEDIDHIISAFTHSVIVNSNGTMIVTDVQGKP